MPDSHEHTTELSRKSSQATKASAEQQSFAYRDSKVAKLNMSEHIEGLVAVHAKEYQRYDRDIIFPRYHNKEFWVDPLTLKFGLPIEIDKRWECRVHPEGILYYRDKERHVLTDAHLYNDSTRKTINNYIDKIGQYIDENQLSERLPKSRTLVLEIRKTGRCGYYFVDHDNQSLFWLEPYDAIDMIEYLKIKMTLPLFEWEMRAQYWYHNELFPDDIPISNDIIRTFKHWLIMLGGDVMTSSQSTSTYSLSEIEKLLSFIGNMKAEEINGKEPSGAAWIVYRAMSAVCHRRFLDLYGQHGARLNQTQSVHSPRKTGLLLKFVSPLLFFAPEEHFSRLSELSTDSVVKRTGWFNFLAEITDEWRNHTLFATVLLNANVAFLAIQSVDSAKPNFGYRTSAQRSSYASIVASTGAIVLGLGLVRRHKNTGMGFLANRSASVIGLELIAIMYGLPYALAMWSVLLFFIAFTIMCFSSGDTTTDILISISCFFVVLMSVWIISTSYEGRPYWKFSMLMWWDGVRPSIQGLLGGRAPLDFGSSTRSGDTSTDACEGKDSLGTGAPTNEEDVKARSLPLVV